MPIEEEILNATAFKSPQKHAQVNILYTATWLNKHSNAILKPFNLTLQQFNILRILRGCKGKPATIKLLTSRMFDKMSNASRLVDKLVNKGWAERKRSNTDRRQVEIVITDTGMELLEQANNALDTASATYLSSLTTEEANQINELLNKMRGNCSF